MAHAFFCRHATQAGRRRVERFRGSEWPEEASLDATRSMASSVFALLDLRVMNMMKVQPATKDYGLQGNLALVSGCLLRGADGVAILNRHGVTDA